MADRKPLNVFWVLPYTQRRSGGPLVALRTAQLIDLLPGFKSELVLSHEKDNREYRNFNDAIREAKKLSLQTVFAVTYGPLIPRQIVQIKKNCKANFFVYAQSFGWPQHRVLRFLPRFRLPWNPDIVCVSRYVMAQWNAHSQKSRIALVPPALNSVFFPGSTDRDIDVLLHVRKQDEYCLNQLLPVLRRTSLHVKELVDWLSQEELARLLRRTKVFLYHTKLFVAGRWRYPLGEALGLPPLEALVCGAHVATNALGGVNDFLDQENSIKLLGRDPVEDCALIETAVKRFEPNLDLAEALAIRYSKKRVAQLWLDLLSDWYL
jgi:glycosyltransferase involved in cell wall biosynthesis